MFSTIYKSIRRVPRTVATVTAVLSTLMIHAQTAGMPAVKYMRPAMSVALITQHDANKERIYEAFKALPVPNKFDDHRVQASTIAKAINTTDQAVRVNDLHAALNPLSRDLVAKWFNRDEQGGMGTETILQRGDYTKTDLDVILNRQTKIDRSSDQGWQLLDKTYLVVYEIIGVTKENPTRTVTTKKGKVEEKMEGWSVEYRADLFKLAWNDSVEFQFTQQYWNPRESHDATRAANWAQASFPLQWISSTNGKLQELQPMEPKNLLGMPAEKPPVELLLNKFPAEIQETAIRRFSRSVTDFNPRAPVMNDWPMAVTAKLGTKEGLATDHRFFAYEMKLRQGELKAVRRGTVRVTNAANNESVATGNSAPSYFKQQGGKALRAGDLLIAKNDLGVNVSGGWTVSDALMSGPAATVKGNLGRLVSWPGLYIGAHLGIPLASDLDGNGLVHTRRLQASPSTLWKGSGLFFGGVLSKEIYFTRRGNVYVEPTVGYGITTFNFNYDGSESDKKYLAYKSRVISVGTGIGFHVGTLFALEVRPMMNLRSKYKFDDDDKTGAIVHSTTAGDGLGQEAADLAKAFESKALLSTMLALKIRF